MEGPAAPGPFDGPLRWSVMLEPLDYLGHLIDARRGALAGMVDDATRQCLADAFRHELMGAASAFRMTGAIDDATFDDIVTRAREAIGSATRAEPLTASGEARVQVVSAAGPPSATEALRVLVEPRAGTPVRTRAVMEERAGRTFIRLPPEARAVCVPGTRATANGRIDVAFHSAESEEGVETVIATVPHLLRLPLVARTPLGLLVLDRADTD